MSLTFGQAKEILAQYQGKGGKVPNARNLDQFVLKVMGYLLITGGANKERSFELCVVNGWFTAPYELETPLKVKVNGGVGQVVSRWFEFRSAEAFGQGDCYDAASTVFEDSNPYYTAYDIPSGGAYVGVMGTAEEDCDASLIVQGKDLTGRTIFTNHKGAEIAGEYLDIKKGTISWSNVRFAAGPLEGIVKSRTTGHVELFWKQSEEVRGFLSNYSPIEEVPTYRRFRLSKVKCPPMAKINILGRVRIKEAYADSDRIPFDNRFILEMAGQQANSFFNKELEAGIQQDKVVQDLVTREATHKKVNNGTPVEVFYGTSAGTIKGIV